MNKYWSTYIQQPDELYVSRDMKFRDDKKDVWLNALQIKSGMKVLEVGCGTGLLSHKIKKYYPTCNITGVDLDTCNIEYANKKSQELNLQCNFLCGDVADLPFEDNSFDLCFSHTVSQYCEPVKFTSEQYRVLKPGGKIVLLSVLNNNQKELWVPDENCEEIELFGKLWDEAMKNENSKVKTYESNAVSFCNYFYKQGFKNIITDTFSLVFYAPDSADLDIESAVKQINGNRMFELSSIKSAHNMAPNALTDKEYNSMIDMVNRRFDKKIEQFINGEKTWDCTVSTTLVISAEK